MSILEVVDREGWKREYPLQNAIMHIGSAPTNDIILEMGHGGGVSHRHAQLITAGAAGYRLINLGDSEIWLVSEGNRALSPLASADLGPGASVRIGEFTLVLRGAGTSAGANAGTGGAFAAALGAAGVSSTDMAGLSAAMASAGVATSGGAGDTAAAPDFFGSERTSDMIWLAVSLPTTQLVPNRTIEGAIKVRNQGNRPGVQFNLEIENMPPECYEIGPAPILFPNVEKDVFLRIHHAGGSGPPAGEHSFLVRASAPDAYPGESAAVSQIVYISPIYKHEMKLIVDDE